jgi:hypothetical protein
VNRYNQRPNGETSAGYHPDGRLVGPIRHHSPATEKYRVYFFKYIRTPH